MDFNIYVGAETGSLKGVNLNPKAVIAKNLYRVKGFEKDYEITAMAWGNMQEDEILLGLRNQTVASFDTTYNETNTQRPAITGKGPITSIARWDGLLVVGAESGELAVWQGLEKRFEINTTNGLKGERTLTRARQNPINKDIFATVGKDNVLQLWNLNDPKHPSFQAKNVKPDMLQLKVPLWPTDVTFMSDGHSIATCTKHKHVRLYDPRTQRRPLISFTWLDEPLNCITCVPNTNQVIVGASTGRMGHFDLRGRKPEMPIGVFRGAAGAVRDLAIHPTLPIVCMASLDRFLRIYHIESKKLLHQEYLKTRLNTVLIRSTVTLENLPQAPSKKRSIEESNKNSKKKCNI